MRKLRLVGLSAAIVVAMTAPALAAGDADAGQAAFAANCGLCHQAGPNAQNGLGPELNGIVGRKAANVTSFASYSEGMKKLGGEGYVWTEENLDKWIADPKALLPDSVMAQAFPGLPDADQRANIMAYLKTQ